MKTTNKHTDGDNFSRIIRDKLENYSLPIEKDSWDELEKRLNAKPKKKLALWPWISGVSAAASIALVITLSYHKNLSNHETTNLSNHAERIAENVPEEENLSSAVLPSVQTQPIQQQRNRRKVLAPEGLALREPDVVSPEETIQKDYESTVYEQVIQGKRPPDPIQEQKLIISQKLRNKNRSIAFHVSSGGGQYAANPNNRDFSSVLSPSRESFAVLPSYSYEDCDASDKRLSSTDFDQITHYPPISIGVSVRKALNDYFSVESGLTYTYLYSSFENKIPRQEANLTLHYLGIPINLAFHLYPHSRSPWNIYLSAGGMVEKGLLSHYVQNTYSISNGEGTPTVSNEQIRGLQWSIHAALGLSYRFNRGYSIFLEPRVSYYLDNNQPFNVRTEHPFVPGINIGLRHTWNL